MDEAANKKYIDFIRSLPKKFKKEDLLVNGLLMGSENNLKMYYAPFDYVNRNARVVIIGITPFTTQMEKAISCLKQQIESNKPIDFKNIKKEAAFVGKQTRQNLINTLNQAKINVLLDIDTCERLFKDTNELENTTSLVNEDNFKLLHTTSLIKYPVFNKGENYRGSSPKILSSNLLKKYAEKEFLKELEDIKDFLIIIPLGKKVSEVLRRWITDKCRPDIKNKIKDKCLFDFPHPSGANNGKVSEYLKPESTLMKGHLKIVEKIIGG